MKNFYEATAIRPTLRLELVLRVKPYGVVKSHIQINDANWIIVLTEETVFKHNIDLTSPVDIQIQISRQHPEALEIELEIDGCHILPLYQDLAYPPTCYLNNNSIWSFKIPSFYPWYHAITGQGWIA